MSRQAWDELISSGRVKIAGRVEKKGGAVVPGGAIIAVDLPPLGLHPDEVSAQPVWVSPDRKLAVFNKDSLIPTYPLLPWENGTLANRIARFCEEQGWMSAADYAALAEPPVLEGGLLQRLDEGTSGLVTSAFTSSAKDSYRKVFSGQVEKGYLAIVTGEPVSLQGKHQLFFKTNAPKVSASTIASPGALEACLSIKILSSASGHGLVEVTTSQGLRHVVRAGLAALGHPLAGDSFYGGSTAATFHQLHAHSLQIPGFAKVTSSPPQSFLDCLKTLRLQYSA